MLSFLRRMLRNMDRDDFCYLIILHFILVGVFGIFKWFSGKEINLNVPLAEEKASFYFSLGFFVDRYLKENISVKQFVLLHAASAIAIIISFFMAYYYIKTNHSYTNGADYHFSDALLVFPVTAVYLSAYKLFSAITLPDRSAKIIGAFGKASFGVYLLEVLFDTGTYDVYFFAKRIFSPLGAWIVWVLFDYCMGSIAVVIVLLGLNKLKQIISKKAVSG